MSRRTRLARLAVALVSLALLAAAFAWQCHERPPDLDSWDRPRLARELEALDYHTHHEPRDRVTAEGRRVLAGTYCWRDGAATTWQEAAPQMAGQAGRWRGLVVARRSPRGLAAEPAPEALQAGAWLLVGDPAELDRIAARLALPR